MLQLSQCSVFSAELVAAAICCCLRGYRSMPSHRGVKSIRLRPYVALLLCAASTVSTAPAPVLPKAAVPAADEPSARSRSPRQARRPV